MHTINFPMISKIFVAFAYLILIVFSPSIHFIQYITFHDCQRVLQLILLAFVLVDAASYLATPHKLLIISQNIRIGSYILIALAATSAFYAIDSRQAMIEISVFVALCYLALFVAKQYEEDKELFIKWFTYALWTSILLYMLSFYVGYVTALLFGKRLQWPSPLYGFTNVRLFQQYQLWGLGLICLPLLSFSLQKKTRFYLHFALASWWVLLFYAASRGVTIAWFVGLFVTAIMYQKSAWPFLRIQLINATFGLTAYLVLFKAIPTWLASTRASDIVVTGTVFRSMIDDRLVLWEAAYNMIKDSPLLGVGPMHFYFHTELGTHPHNSLLQLASEFGLPATAIILSVTGYSLYCWMKKFSAKQVQKNTKQNANISIILFFTISANAAYSLVEGVIIMPISQVLMFTFIGLMIGQYIEGSQHNTYTQINKKELSFGPLFAIASLVVMAFTTFPELKRGITANQRHINLDEAAFSVARDVIAPRIWVQQRRVEPENQLPTLP